MAMDNYSGRRVYGVCAAIVIRKLILILHNTGQHPSILAFWSVHCYITVALLRHQWDTYTVQQYSNRQTIPCLPGVAGPRVIKWWTMFTKKFDSGGHCPTERQPTDQVLLNSNNTLRFYPPSHPQLEYPQAVVEIKIAQPCCPALRVEVDATVD